MYMVRALGGLLYLTGAILGGYNILMTWKMRPAAYEVPVYEAPALTHEKEEADYSKAPYPGALGRMVSMAWHRVWEGKGLVFTIWVVVAVASASLFEIIPTFLIKSNVPTIASVKPYTPLELYGRDLYVSEGCYNCHSQMVRPFRAETLRYGEYSKPGEFIYDHPFQWSSRRIGPDLHRVGGKYSGSAGAMWHLNHFRDPQKMTPGSIMPRYPWFEEKAIDFASIQNRVDAMAMLGVPYGDAVNRAEEMAREQANQVAMGIASAGGPMNLGDKQVVAMIAYLQRLGTDITAAK
jgi:cytochrome c oxidase cbb3-type subunit I/II